MRCRNRSSPPRWRLLDGKTATALLELRLVTDAGLLLVEVKAASQRDAGKVVTIAGWVRDPQYGSGQGSRRQCAGAPTSLDLVENISDACVVENAEGGGI